MAEAQVLVERLLALQNPDGGWPYDKGTTWAEPTAFALLGLQSTHTLSTSPAVARGIGALLSAQKPTGGWSPHPHVDECTSVTSVATLALLACTGPSIPMADLSTQRLDAALAWTAGQVYRDNLSFSLLLAKAFNLPPAHAPGSVPWYPGTAGWVTPTALTVLALSRASRLANRADLRDLALKSCTYLLSRRCADGGWNHGGSNTRSEDATAYPETTGLALLALRAASIAPPPDALALAAKFAANPESTEGLSWLQMALRTSTRAIPDPPVMPTPRTSRDIALRLLALSAQSGSNIFLGD